MREGNGGRIRRRIRLVNATQQLQLGFLWLTCGVHVRVCECVRVRMCFYIALQYINTHTCTSHVHIGERILRRLQLDKKIGKQYAELLLLKVHLQLKSESQAGKWKTEK